MFSYQPSHLLYFFIIFCLSVVLGLQIIVVPWLAIDYIQLSAWAVGFIQGAVLIPNLALLILGGINADRGNLLTKFSLLLVIYGIIHIVLAVLLSQDWLSFFWLLFYALLLGCISAFIQPCKDYLAGSLADDDFQSVIAKNSFCQYFGQAVGVGLATQLYYYDLFFIPLVQVLLLLVAFIVLLRVKSKYSQAFSNRKESKTTKAMSRELLLSGFSYCWQSTVLRSLIFIVAVSGFFHIGVFIVALPILAKTIYVGNVEFYGLLQAIFIVGTVVATVIVVVRGQLDGPGRRVIFGLLYAGFILLGLSAQPTVYGLLFLIFLWGVVVGVSATLGRSILQSYTSEEYKGRMISIYQLALFGFAPLGSLFAGIAINLWGVLFVLKLSAIISFMAFFSTFFIRSLWDVETKNDVLPK